MHSITRRVAQAAEKVRRARRPTLGRSIAVDETDVFVTSYPRSGNTWIRFLLTAVMKPGEPLGDDLVRRTVPDIYSPGRIETTGRPRVLKSHEYFDPRYKRVLYLARDPRDVAVSYFHFHARAGGPHAGITLEEFVERMVAGTVDNFGTWREHVQSWLATRAASDEFLLVRYEDLRNEPYEQSARIMSFIPLPSTPDTLRRAIEATSLGEMKRIASRDISPQRQKLLARRGEPGGWKEELPPASAALIEAEFGDAMRALGYL